MDSDGLGKDRVCVHTHMIDISVNYFSYWVLPLKICIRLIEV